jgi:hypothetical protein
MLNEREKRLKVKMASRWANLVERGYGVGRSELRVADGCWRGGLRALGTAFRVRTH